MGAHLACAHVTAGQHLALAGDDNKIETNKMI
jgi:hypothetical protein